MAGISDPGLMASGFRIQRRRLAGVFSAAPDQFDWTGFDQVINEASKQGLKVMLSIVTAPEWSRPSAAGLGIEGPPDDLNAYAKFVGEVVDRYKGKVHAIEIWNEQNIDAEWKTTENKQRARYYRLTAKGRKMLAAEESRWNRMVEAIGRVLRPV